MISPDWQGKQASLFPTHSPRAPPPHRQFTRTDQPDPEPTSRDPAGRCPDLNGLINANPMLLVSSHPHPAFTITRTVAPTQHCAGGALQNWPPPSVSSVESTHGTALPIHLPLPILATPNPTHPFPLDITPRHAPSSTRSPPVSLLFPSQIHPIIPMVSLTKHMYNDTVAPQQ